MHAFRYLVKAMKEEEAGGLGVVAAHVDNRRAARTSAAR